MDSSLLRLPSDSFSFHPPSTLTSFFCTLSSSVKLLFLPSYFSLPCSCTTLLLLVNLLQLSQLVSITSSRQYVVTSTMCKPIVLWYTCGHLLYNVDECPDKDTDGHERHETTADCSTEMCPVCPKPDSYVVDYLKSTLLTATQLAGILDADAASTGFLAMIARFYARGDHKHFNQPGPPGADVEGEALVRNLEEKVQNLRAMYGTAALPLPGKVGEKIPGYAFDIALNDLAGDSADTTSLDMNGESVKEPDDSWLEFLNYTHSPASGNTPTPTADVDASSDEATASLVNSASVEATSSPGTPVLDNGQGQQVIDTSPARATPAPVTSQTQSPVESIATSSVSSNGQMNSQHQFQNCQTPMHNQQASQMQSPSPMLISSPVQDQMNNMQPFQIPMTAGAYTYDQIPMTNQFAPQMQSYMPVQDHINNMQQFMMPVAGYGMNPMNTQLSPPMQSPVQAQMDSQHQFRMPMAAYNQQSPPMQSPMMGMPTSFPFQGDMNNMQQPQMPMAAFNQQSYQMQFPMVGMAAPAPAQFQMSNVSQSQMPMAQHNQQSAQMQHASPAPAHGQVYPQNYQAPQTPTYIQSRQATPMAMGSPAAAYSQAPASNQCQTPSPTTSNQTSSPDQHRPPTSMGPPAVPAEQVNRKRTVAPAPSPSPKRARQNNGNGRKLAQPTPRRAPATPTNLNLDGSQNNTNNNGTAAGAIISKTFDTKRFNGPRKSKSPTKPKLSNKAVKIIQHPSMMNPAPAPAPAAAGAGTPASAANTPVFRVGPSTPAPMAASTQATVPAAQKTAAQAPPVDAAPPAPSYLSLPNQGRPATGIHADFDPCAIINHCAKLRAAAEKRRDEEVLAKQAQQTR